LTTRESSRINPALWLFDFDNTLAALEPEVDWAASRRELEAYLRDQGIGDAIFREFPKGNLVLYEALRSRFHAGTHPLPSSISVDTLLRQASEIIESYELRGVERAAPLPGAEALLRLLADTGAVAIVTSNSSRTIARWLERHRVAGVVRAVVGRDSMLPLKPAPDSVERALGLCSTDAADAVFVGDSEADFKAALSAHVAFLGVAAKAQARAQLTALGAKTVFESPAALAAFFGLPLNEKIR
jgi:phosphoglycolate phosphatase-like HAD superfamily hydrolase